MTEKDLLKITDRKVGEKVLEMMSNSFKALFEKEFGTETFEAQLQTPAKSIMWMFTFDENQKFKMPAYLCQLSLKLTDWTSSTLQLGFDINENIRILKYIWEVKKLTGQTRVNEFKNRCDDENVKYEIFYLKNQLYSEVSTKIMEIGKGVFKINKSAGYSRKFTFTLIFDCDIAQKKSPVTMQVFFSDHDDFLECLQNFAKECKKKKLDTIEKIQEAMESLPIREYRLVTKKVLCKLIKEDKSHNSLQTNLGLGKLGTNLKNKLFAGNQSLEYVYLPDGMKEIPDSLFMFCENLRSVQIPESVEEIGYKAFYGCKNLKYVNLPKHLTSICSKAFAFCDSLPDLDVPKNCVVSSDAFMSEWDAYGECEDPYYVDSELLNIYGDSENWY